MKKSFSRLRTILLTTTTPLIALLLLSSCLVFASAASKTTMRTLAGDKVRLEGEASLFAGTTRTEDYSVASGGKVVAYLDQVGNSITFKNVSKAKGFTLAYTRGNSGDGNISLYINDVHTRDIRFPNTGGWGASASYYKTLDIAGDIPQGANIKLQYDLGDEAVNVDYIELYSVDSSAGAGSGTNAGTSTGTNSGTTPAQTPSTPTPTPAKSTKYIDSPYFEEITAAQADKMYADGENFNLLYYSPECGNCESIKPYIEELINTYKIKLYGVDGLKTKSGLDFMWEKFSGGSMTSTVSITYPVIMVNKGKDGLVAIQQALDRDLVKKTLVGNQPGNTNTSKTSETPATPATPAATANSKKYIDSPYFEEITAAQADQMYADGKNFNLLFFSPECLNCASMKPYIKELIDTYKIKLYGVDGLKGEPGLSFMWAKFPKGITYPVIMVNKGKDGLVAIQQALDRDLVKKTLVDNQPSSTDTGTSTNTTKKSETPATPKSSKYINSPYFEEITAAQADKMYAEGKNFNLLFFSPECGNCESIRPYIEELINTYKIKLYGVDGLKRQPGLAFMWAKFSGSITYPVIMVNKGKGGLVAIQQAVDRDLVKKTLVDGQPSASDQTAPKEAPMKTGTINQSGIFTGKYGVYQVFDAQKAPLFPKANVSFSVTNFKAPSDAVLGAGKKIDWGKGSDNYISLEYAGNYDQIVSPTSSLKNMKKLYADKVNPPVAALKLYSKAGVFIKNIATVGFVWGIGDQGFIYTAFDKNSLVNYFFANKQGYSYNSSLAYIPKSGIVQRVEDLTAYMTSTKPLGLGEIWTAAADSSAQPAAVTPSTPAAPTSTDSKSTAADTKTTDTSSRKAAIIEKWNQYKPSFTGQIYLEQPSVSAPYKAGQLTSSFVNDGTKMVNFVRFLAGLPDDVVIDDTIANKAQTGSVLLTKEFSHTPAKPGDMDDAFYSVGYAATSSSNIAMGFRTLDQSIKDGYMRDSDTGNMDRLGHRRWLLNPALQKIAFGFAENGRMPCSNVMVFDQSRPKAVDYDYVAWPNKEDFPNNFFSGADPWSITLNPNKYIMPDLSSVSVTVVRASDGKSWTLDKNCNKPSNTGNYFNVNNSGYGVPGCIIFRPENITAYDNNSTYQVTVKGIQTKDGKDATISYSVNFFSMP